MQLLEVLGAANIAWKLNPTPLIIFEVVFTFEVIFIFKVIFNFEGILILEVIFILEVFFIFDTEEKSQKGKVVTACKPSKPLLTLLLWVQH